VNSLSFTLNLGLSGDLSELVRMVSQTRPCGGKTSSDKPSQILYKIRVENSNKCDTFGYISDWK
jgi:hypothetical protein